MSLSCLELSRILGALSDLPGATLQNTFQPSRTELVLELRRAGKNQLLLLCVQAPLTRLHRINSRPPNPPQPFAFQMLCRRELSGPLEQLVQVGNDRIVRLEFGGQQPRLLVAELTGRHANVMLLDGEGLLLGSLLPLRHDRRELKPGAPYRPPEGPLPPPGPDRFAELPEDALENAIAEHYARASLRLRTETLRHQLQARLRRALKRLNHRQRQLEDDLARAETAEAHRRFGDLLQIHLASVPRGASSVLLPDSFREDEAPVCVPLDPGLDPVANLQRHYRLYRKYDASIGRVLERLDATEHRARALEAILAQTDAAPSLEALQALQTLAELPEERQSAQARARKGSERLPYLSFFTPNGAEIRVGRGAQDNDALTFRHSRGNDFWLHARGRPGAHVVVPFRGRVPDLETLLDAACLALKFSRGETGQKGEVAYTRVKYVRKVAGTPGLVTYSQEKTLLVELDAARLERLQKSEEG